MDLFNDAEKRVFARAILLDAICIYDMTRHYIVGGNLFLLLEYIKCFY